MTAGDYFHNIGNMESKHAVAILGVMAQESRLGIFRLLVQAGPEGLSAGRIGREMKFPAPTLSFHLSQLKHAGLVVRRREGTSLIYSADFDAMNTLVGFLTDNCCGSGAACAPVCEVPRVKTRKKARTR
ncbi:MAG TPA: metalloregulator ArsR/SmtB family transcription factor [Burkholderiales bacterium]